MLVKLLKRIFIGDEWEQKRQAEQAAKWQPFLDRVKRHNGRVKFSRAGYPRVEFCCREDEAAYYSEIVRTAAERHGDSIDRIFKDVR